jgi:hypothetical protein
MGLTFQHILKTLQHISLFNTFFNQNAKKKLYNTFLRNTLICVFKSEKFDFKTLIEKKIYFCVFKSENFNLKSYFLMLFRLKLGLKGENFTFKHTNRIFFFKCVVKIFFSIFN